MEYYFDGGRVKAMPKAKAKAKAKPKAKPKPKKKVACAPNITVNKLKQIVKARGLKVTAKRNGKAVPLKKSELIKKACI